MKIGIVAPSPVPFTRGGAERRGRGWPVRSTPDAPRRRAREAAGAGDHPAPAVRGLPRLRPPRREPPRPGGHLEVPAWIVAHPYHIVWMFHPLRGLYDTYHTFGMPERAEPTVLEVADLVRFLDGPPLRSELDGCFELWDRALRAAGPDHPRALPAVPGGPPARALARRGRAGTAGRAPPPGPLRHHRGPPRLLPAGHRSDRGPRPSDLPARTGSGSSYLFTASRLDGPKRLDLLIDAMAHVRQEIPLLIGGPGRAEDLRLRAGNDRRVKFLGFVPDRDLTGLYANAGGALRAGRRGLRAHHRRGHGLRHPGGVLHRQRRAHRADHPRRQRPRHGADADGARCRLARWPPSRTGPAGWVGPPATRALDLTWASTVATVLDSPWTGRSPPEPVIDLTEDEPVISSPAAVPARATRPKVVVLSTFEIHRAAPRRPAPVLPPVRQPGPPPRRAGAQPGGARPPGRHPHAGARLLEERSPRATSTTRSVGARRSTRDAGHRHRRRHRDRPLPAYLSALRSALDDAAARAPGRALPAPALEAVEADVPWIYGTRSTSRPT